MALSAETFWRVRVDGSDTLCSGCFDPSVSGAGTDYTEQTSAQLALTDLASTTPYTTITSATGGFTAAMIGNGIYIASGTGFTAGRYIITGVTNTNTATIDRACAAASASGGVAYLGGALATPWVIKTIAPFTANYGNVVYIRGQGSNDPLDIDYAAPTNLVNDGAYFNFIGYYGRPKIGHTGRAWYFSSIDARGTTFENFYFVQTAGTITNIGAIASQAANNILATNCVFDQGGFNARMVTSISLDRCSFINTGAQTTGTQAAFTTDANTGRYPTIRNCLFKDLNCESAIKLPSGQAHVIGNVIQNCSGTGISVTMYDIATYSAGFIDGNTIDSCGGHGIELTSFYGNHVINNIISNITTSGKYGVYVTSGASTASAKYSSVRVAHNNFYGNTNNCNVAIPSTNGEIDPQYANAPSDLTPTNTALRVLAGIGAYAA